MGSQSAAARAFSVYYGRLLDLSVQLLRDMNLGHGSGEDFVMSAFKSFWRAIHEGRTNFNTRSDLWAFLSTLTIRKILMERRKQRNILLREKLTRIDKAILLAPDASVMISQFAGLKEKEVSSQVLLEIEEESHRLVHLFADNEKLQNIIRWRLEEFSPEEIGQKLNLHRRTVLYHLDKIKERWLRIRTLSDLIELKFAGISDEETAKAVGLPTKSVLFFREGMLRLWSKEQDTKLNSPCWQAILNEYLETGIIRSPDNLCVYHNSSLSPRTIQKGLDQIADRWKDHLWTSWRKILDDSWERFATTTQSLPKLPNSPDLIKSNKKD